MFKVLNRQTIHSLLDTRCQYLIRDRLSFMWLGLGLAVIPQANPMWTVREVLKRADAIDGRDPCRRGYGAAKERGNIDATWVQLTIGRKKPKRQPRPERTVANTKYFNAQRGRAGVRASEWLG